MSNTLDTDDDDNNNNYALIYIYYFLTDTETKRKSTNGKFRVGATDSATLYTYITFVWAAAKTVTGRPLLRAVVAHHGYWPVETRSPDKCL